MNIQRKTVEMELNGKSYEAVLDFGAAIEFEGLTGKSIISEMQNLEKTNSIATLAYIMASVIKKEKNKSVGIKLIETVDLIEGSNYFIEKMNELFENSLMSSDEEEDEDVKKKMEV